MDSLTTYLIERLKNVTGNSSPQHMPLPPYTFRDVRLTLHLNMTYKIATGNNANRLFVI